MGKISRERLADSSIHSLLEALPGWSFDANHIQKTFANRTYMHGVAFAVAVAHLADELDHHPELTLEYPAVRVRIQTHDAGGVSALDLALAERIEHLLHRSDG